jgi:hypothetical protein
MVTRSDKAGSDLIANILATIELADRQIVRIVVW